MGSAEAAGPQFELSVFSIDKNSLHSHRGASFSGAHSLTALYPVCNLEGGAMHLKQHKLITGAFVLGLLLVLDSSVSAQNSFKSGRPVASVTALDSNKEQDGLVGSVRRIQTESAALVVKSGVLTEGPRQLLEVTTYNLKGDRIDNVTYPMVGSLAGKEEYKYDEKGHIVEMTLRGADGSIVSRENYTYEYDRIGNWIKMVSSLVVFEGGKLKSEPVEVTYRTITYYFDDAVAKIVESPSVTKRPTREVSSGSTVSAVGNGLNSISSTTPPSMRPSAQPIIKAPETVEIKVDNPAAAAPESEPRKVAEPSRQPDETKEATPKVTAPPPASSTADASPSNAAPSKAPINLYELGLERLHAGNFKEAVDALQQYVKEEPESAKAYLNLGYSYVKLNKSKDAIKAFRQAIKKNPQLEEAHYLLGGEYLKTRNFHDSAAAFKRATEVRPDMAQAHYGLALAYQELGKTDLVIQQYRTLQRLDSALAKQLATTFPDMTLLPCRTGPFCK